MLTVETYEPGVKQFNFNDMLMRIRANAPEAEATADSIVVFNAGTAFPDTVFVKPDPALTKLRIKPVDTIDCIVVSGFPDEALEIARQIQVYKINTTILGDCGWSSAGLYNGWGDYREFIDGTYLISPETMDADEFGSDYFTDDFHARKLELNDIVARKGYDACALLTHCLSRGARNPDALVRALESVDGFHGISTLFRIDSNSHVNTGVEFVRVNDGLYIPFTTTEQ